MAALPIQSTVDRLLSAGLSLSVTPERGLKVFPASGITTELRALILAGKEALIGYLQPVAITTEAANDTTEPFTEPPGYEGTGWRLAGADGISPETLAKFRAASLALDANQSAHDLQIQGAST